MNVATISHLFHVGPRCALPAEDEITGSTCCLAAVNRITGADLVDYRTAGASPSID